MPPGPYLITCTTAGLYESEAVDLDLPAGETALPPFWPLERAVDPRAEAELLGRVHHLGDPVGQALIVVLDRSGGVVAREWTDPAGRYRLGPIAAGPATVIVNVPGLPAEVWTLQVGAGPSVLDLMLHQGMRIS